MVVLTREPALGFLGGVAVASITSTIRGSPTEVVLGIDDGMKWPCAANLDYVSTVPSGKLGRCVATLSAQRMREICSALAFAVGCSAP